MDEHRRASAGAATKAVFADGVIGAAVATLLVHELWAATTSPAPTTPLAIGWWLLTAVSFAVVWLFAWWIRKS